MEDHALKPQLVLAADIGGSHITAALVDPHARCIVEGSLQRGSVRAHGSVKEILADWTEVLQQSLQFATGKVLLGIAMPGPFDYAAGISHIKGFHKYEALFGRNVKSLLNEALDVHGIRMANDARCFLQGELLAGAVQNVQQVMGFTLGTGFGSSIAVDGWAQDAHYYDFPFLASRAEDYFCSRWLVQRYAQLTEKQLVVDVKTIAERASGDVAAQRLFHEFGQHLAHFFALLETPPPVVLLGGNIARSYHLFQPGLEEGLRQYRLHVKIVLASLGEAAPLYGAAALFLQD